MKKKRKNVLLITADQWRGDTLGCMDHHLVQTPNLDQLAADGVLFRKHFTQTVPCGPARASLYTGLYAMNHRSVNNGTPLNARLTNIALEARKSGYDPTIFGYTDTSQDPRELHHQDPLLTTYEGLLPGMTSGVTLTDNPLSWIAELISRGYDPSLNEHKVYVPVPNYPEAEKRGVTFPPPVYSNEDSSTAFLTDELLKWLSVREDENWFVHLSYLRPHPPWIAPEPYNSMYDPADVSKPVRMKSLEQEGEQHPLLKMLLAKIPGNIFFPETYEGLAAETSEKDVLQARATYYGLMTEIDHHLGRLISYLKKSGQYESTLIVFTSDHGEQLGDHHLFGKTGYFDGSYAIPLIIRNPEITTTTSGHSNAADNHVEVFTEAIDVMPTILEWLDLEIPEELDGSSLLPLLNGNIPDNWRKEAHWEYDFREIGSFQQIIEKQFGLSPDQCSLTVIRDERYKYVHMTALPPLLFDLQEDPEEFINRAEDPDYSHLVLEYSQKLLSWSMLHRDRTLVNINMKFGNLIHWKGPRVLEKFEA
jgi:arylsulfatase A-like enzyme